MRKTFSKSATRFPEEFLSLVDASAQLPIFEHADPNPEVAAKYARWLAVPHEHLAGPFDFSVLDRLLPAER